jgi:colicin import membrane protein
MTMAKVTGAELLRQLRAEADRVAAIAARLRDAVDTVTDPTAAEAEVEAVRAAAEQRATAAEARAAAAEQRTAEAD